MISGCVDKDAKAFTYTPSEDLARTIFFPYIGLLNNHSGDFPAPDVSPGPKPDLKFTTSLLDNDIEKAENISLKIKTGIERYKAGGKDVSRLEALLEDYDRLINEAKQYRALADKSFETENNSSTENNSQYNVSSENLGKDYLVLSQKKMMQANRVLRDIFDEIQSLSHGSEELNNTSQLISIGQGKAMFMGSFTLNMHLENGEMAILDLSNDSEIDINGNYTFEEKNNDSPDMDDSHNKVRLYYINSSDVNISGSRKTILLSCENINLTSDGEGYAAFQGNGTYIIEEAGKIVKEEKWTTPFFEDRMSSEEHKPSRRNNNTEIWA